MTEFQKDPSLQVGAICDVYEPNLERAVSTASKSGTHPKTPEQGIELIEAEKKSNNIIQVGNSPLDWENLQLRKRFGSNGRRTPAILSR